MGSTRWYIDTILLHNTKQYKREGSPGQKVGFPVSRKLIFIWCSLRCPPPSKVYRAGLEQIPMGTPSIPGWPWPDPDKSQANSKQSQPILADPRSILRDLARCYPWPIWDQWGPSRDWSQPILANPRQIWADPRSLGSLRKFLDGHKTALFLMKWSQFVLLVMGF